MIPLPPSRLRASLTERPRTRPARVTDNRETFRATWTRQHAATNFPDTFNQ
jgi:hypothetical protein